MAMTILIAASASAGSIVVSKTGICSTRASENEMINVAAISMICGKMVAIPSMIEGIISVIFSMMPSAIVPRESKSSLNPAEIASVAPSSPAMREVKPSMMVFMLGSNSLIIFLPTPLRAVCMSWRLSWNCALALMASSDITPPSSLTLSLMA